MKKETLASSLDAIIKTKGDWDAPVLGGYAGDFLSFVMGKAPNDAVWFTVMNNVNVAAVALLTEVGAVVLCEGVKADPLLLQRCEKEGITLLETKQDIFSASVTYAKQLDA